MPGIALLLLCGSAANAQAPVSAGAAATVTSSPVGHVFVVVLENKDYDVTFGARQSGAVPVADAALSQGQLLTQYHGIGHVSLDNYLAMISGQAPNSDHAVGLPELHRTSFRPVP